MSRFRTYGPLVWIGFDDAGKPAVLKRTPTTHPYNYDSFLLFANTQYEGLPAKSVYSDRLYQWDAEKHDRLCTEFFGNTGQYWDQRDPELIEAFLQAYFDEPELVLVHVTQHCNQATGFPCWQMDYA
ncbi:hypothetical protein [Marinobacterium lutimaris]|uniref:Uncharacterized protein n=1 Tax=Marinobacterium lutimaris TaxID=568106 RepID=A0A1H5XUR1_9GAMM|nr:hypothetical protein [Marinobacterium lutimaris]SEG15471.1 hypothetical protein SAMN05444390_1011512 [Marinobacterium lutimaris]